MLDKSLNPERTREAQLREHFDIQELEPECKDEYIKIPLDLPWDELEKDIPLAFEKYGWYGMVHRMKNDWERSPLYGGLGLTYNPDYRFDIPHHSQGFGQPRSTKPMDVKGWMDNLENYDYSDQTESVEIKGFNTYDDCLGLRVPTEVTQFRSFTSIFSKLKRQMFQGRIAEVRAAEYGARVSEENKEFIWHTDERNEIISRILIPIVYNEDYYLEFKDTGTRLDFEPGYAYHFNTYKIHRWNFDYHENIKNRTCIVLGWSPWLEYKEGTWSVNEYCNKMHPMDMVKAGLVI